MDDQIKPQEPVNQEPVTPQESPILEEPLQTEVPPQIPEPEPTPQPETPVIEQTPEPEIPEVQPQPETSVPSNEYQQILNQYAVSQEQPVVEAPPEASVPEAPISYNIPTASKTNVFKIIFTIALIIFILVLAALAFTYFKNQPNSSNSSNFDTVKTSPTPISTATCLLNDKTYTVGESFPSVDGCNTCSCLESTEIICTEKACAPTPTKVATSSANFSILKRVPQGKEIGDESTENLTKGPLKAVSITFNKSADPKTITDETFYVLEGIGAKVPGKISYNSTTKTATITFTNSISKINENIIGLTVVIKGIKDISNNLIKETTYNIRIN